MKYEGRRVELLRDNVGTYSYNYPNPSTRDGEGWTADKAVTDDGPFKTRPEIGL